MDLFCTRYLLLKSHFLDTEKNHRLGRKKSAWHIFFGKLSRTRFRRLATVFRCRGPVRYALGKVCTQRLIPPIKMVMKKISKQL